MEGALLKYIRRLVWFIASRLLIFTIAVSVLLCAFYMCMNTANVYIVLSDGLEKRVEVILTREDAPELNNYFHGDFLSADPALTAAFDGSSPYVNYNITSFEHELTVESLWAWPWDSYATCRVVERVPSITGTAIAGRDVSDTVPTWQGRRYNVTLMKTDGRWKIVGMQEEAVIIEATPTPSPEPTPTPVP